MRRSGLPALRMVASSQDSRSAPFSTSTSALRSAAMTSGVGWKSSGDVPTGTSERTSASVPAAPRAIDASGVVVATIRSGPAGRAAAACEHATSRSGTSTATAQRGEGIALSLAGTPTRPFDSGDHTLLYSPSARGGVAQLVEHLLRI